MRIHHVVFVFLPRLCPPANADPALMPLAEAKRLVYAALTKETRSLPGLSADLGNPKNGDGRCVTFDIIWANPEPGSVHVDFYTIDRRTGEVWRTMVCERVSNKTLQVQQRDVRRRLGVTEKERREAAEMPSCCPPP